MSEATPAPRTRPGRDADRRDHVRRHRRPQLDGQVAFVTGGARASGSRSRARWPAGRPRRDLQPQPGDRRPGAWPPSRPRAGKPARSPPTSRSGRAGSRSREGLYGSGASGHAGQQLRHHPRRPPPPHERRAVGGGARTPISGRVPLLPGGGARDDEGALRPDREHLVGGGPDGQCRPGELRGVEGGTARPHQGAGARARRPRDHGERGRPGLHRDRDDGRAARAGTRKPAGPDPARPPRRAGGGGRGGGVPGFAACRLRHRSGLDGGRRHGDG